MFLYHNQASDGFWLLLGHILPSFGLAKNKGLFFGKWLFLTYWSLPLTNLIHAEFSWGVCSSFSQHCAIAKNLVWCMSITLIYFSDFEHYWWNTWNVTWIYFWIAHNSYWKNMDYELFKSKSKTGLTAATAWRNTTTRLVGKNLQKQQGVEVDNFRWRIWWEKSHSIMY